MKTILVIAMVLISLTGKAQGLIYNSIGFKYTPFIQAVCDELEINADIYIMPTDKPVNGFVTKNGFGGYIVFVNNTSKADEPVRFILAHELVHISDDLKGIWDVERHTMVANSYTNKYVCRESEQLEKRVNKEAKEIHWKFRKL